MGRSELYDDIGRTYTATRQTDPRLAAAIWDALADARTVLNVGAGTGSYEPRDREVIVHCRSGVRSVDVIKMLRSLGYNPDNLVNVEGGILAWARQVDSTMPVY